MAIVLSPAWRSVPPLAQVGRLLRIHPMGRQALTVMAAAAGCFGLLPLAVRLATGSVLGSVLAVLAGAAVYLALLVRFRRLLRFDELLRRRRRRTPTAAADPG